jgi:hypothetical protein
LGMAPAGSRRRGRLGRGLDAGAEVPNGTGLRQSGTTAALANCGEQLREQQGREKKIRSVGS